MILDKELKYLLVGWVLGLASSLIVDWIRKRNQKDEFKKAVVSELKGLKFVLVGIVSRLSERIEKLDKNLQHPIIFAIN